MEFQASGTFEGRRVVVRWKDGRIIAPSDITEKITIMDGSFRMVAVPSEVTFNLSDAESVYHFLAHHFFDDEPTFTGQIPEQEPENMIY